MRRHLRRAIVFACFAVLFAPPQPARAQAGRRVLSRQDRHADRRLQRRRRLRHLCAHPRPPHRQAHPGQSDHRGAEHAGRRLARAANYLYNVAPKDGSAIGMFSRGMAMEPLIGASADAIRRDQIPLARQRHQRGQRVRHLAHRAGEDLGRHARPSRSRVGGEGSGSDPDVYAALLKNVFGVKLQAGQRLSGHRRDRARARARRDRRPRELVVVEPEVAEAGLDRARRRSTCRCSSI